MTLPVKPTPDDLMICRQCRGRCCRGYPGVWVDPDRFLRIFSLSRPVSPEQLHPHLPDLDLELRPIDGVPVPAPRSSADGCRLLGPEGCRLPATQRPCQCLALRPELETLLEDIIQCHLPAEASTTTAITRWRRFWKLL